MTFGVQRSTLVEWTTKWIDRATEQGWSYRHAHNPAGVVHAVACFNSLGIVEQNTSKKVAVKRQREADLTAFETYYFVKPNIGQAGHSRNAVGRCLDTTYLLGGRRERRRTDALSCASLSQRSRSGRCPITIQLLADSIEIRTPTVTHDRVGAAKLNAGNQRRINAEPEGQL